MSSSATENTHREMFHKPKHDWAAVLGWKKPRSQRAYSWGCWCQLGFHCQRRSEHPGRWSRVWGKCLSRTPGAKAAQEARPLPSSPVWQNVHSSLCSRPQRNLKEMKKKTMSGGELKTKHKEWHQLFDKINCLFFSFTSHVSLKQLQYKRAVICCYDCYYGSHWKLTQLCCITIFWLRNQCEGGQHCVCDVQCVYKKGPSLWLIIG